MLGVLVQQRFINQAAQHLLTHALHIGFVAGQLGEPLAVPLLQAVTFCRHGIFELAAANLLAINFCGIIIVTANQVVTNASQNE